MLSKPCLSWDYKLPFSSTLLIRPPGHYSITSPPEFYRVNCSEVILKLSIIDHLFSYLIHSEGKQSKIVFFFSVTFRQDNNLTKGIDPLTVKAGQTRTQSPFKCFLG